MGLSAPIYQVTCQDQELLLKVVIEKVELRHHLTWIKNPPDNIKVITTTDASVVAFFTSINAAPIASPRPCNFEVGKLAFYLIS